MARPPIPRIPRARPTAGRIGQLRRQTRMKRFAKKAAGATGSFLLDFLAGFLDINIEKGQKDKLGILGTALGAGIASGGTDNLPLPTMEKPQRVKKDSNPSIATISKRLDSLVKTANKIGVYTKEQQEALIKQINQSRRTAGEQQLEQKAPAIPELPAGGESNNLTPLDDSVTGLIKKIDDLSATIDEMNANGGGFGPLDGLTGSRGGGRGRLPKAPSPKLVRSPTSPTGFRYAAGSAGGIGGRFAPAPASRATSALTNTRRIAKTAVSGLGDAAFAGTARIANLMKKGIKPAARLAGPAVTAAVRRAAGPLISKTLGRTALKSIPIIGAVAGVGFALSRLMQGDVVGAGLDLGSGLGGPLTAIPAFAASIARDSYASVYGVQPEQDPDFNKNYPEIKKAVEDLIKEQLGGAVTPKRTPTDQEIGDQETPKSPIKTSQVVNQPPIASTVPSPATGGNTGTTGAAASSSSGAAAAPASTPVPQGQSNSTGAALNGPTMEPAGTATSDILNAQQVPVRDYFEQYGFMPSQGMFQPQTGTSTREGRQYIGEIPSPVYSEPGLEAFKQTLFFDYP